MNEVLVCTITTTSEFGDVCAILTPAKPSRDHLGVRSGRGPTIERAVGHAMGRPRVRFASAVDEEQAAIAAFREHSFTFNLKGDELCTIGIR